MATFDAVLLIAFGGPQGLDDIRPFLDNVLRHRSVPQHRVDEVARHYELFGGVSPINEHTRRQAKGLRDRLASSGAVLPCYIGMRNWHPLLSDTLCEMSRAGVRRAIGYIMAAHASYSSCQQYRENVLDARATVRARGLRDIEVTYVAGWHADPRFVEANARHILEAMARVPSAARTRARLIFTAHSIPLAMAERSRYREQLLESARLVAACVQIDDWALAYQSRSGRPQDSWLEPDICDYLRMARAQGIEAVVLCPIGFVSDHIEVLYDLDHEAAAVAQQLGLGFARAEAVNDDPIFLDLMADRVLAVVARYAGGRPLPLLHARSPADQEAGAS